MRRIRVMAATLEWFRPSLPSKIVHDSAFYKWWRPRQNTEWLLPSAFLDYLKSLLICRRVSRLIVWWYFICLRSSPDPFRFSDVLWPPCLRCTKVTLLCKLWSLNVKLLGGIFKEPYALIANTMFAGIGRPVDCNGALWTVISLGPTLEDFRIYSYETRTLRPMRIEFLRIPSRQGSWPRFCIRLSRLLVHETCPDITHPPPLRVLCCGALRRSTRGGRGKACFEPGIGSKLRDRGVSYPTIAGCL